MRFRITILILAGLLFGNLVLAYDDATTHPALTDEIIDFYNLFFDKKLNAGEKEWIVKGAMSEDLPPRWINHFYDPINKAGWSGEKAGVWSQMTIQYFSGKVLSSAEPVSSLNWLHNQKLQSEYGDYGGNHTWERAIYEYANGNVQEAYYTLGYILHLIEDAAVPDHTRNDTHAHELRYMTGDYGSPYEEYGKQFNRNNLLIADELKNQGYRPITLNSIDDYLISLAEYSNKYFFSKDTINDQKYVYPRIVREENDYGYGIDENGEEFELLAIKTVRDLENMRFKSEYFFPKDDKDNRYKQILFQYFTRLSREAIINGAGIIDLFLREGETAKQNLDSLEKPPQETSTVTSLMDEVYGVIAFWSDAKNNVVAAAANIKNIAIGITATANDAVSNVIEIVSPKISGLDTISPTVNTASFSEVIFNREEIPPVIQSAGAPPSGGFVAAETSTGNGEENVNFANQAIQNTSIQPPTLSYNNKLQLLSQIQTQFESIAARAGALAREVNQLQSNQRQVFNQISYSGGGGGAPVIVTVNGGGGNSADNSGGGAESSLPSDDSENSENDEIQQESQQSDSDNNQEEQNQLSNPAQSSAVLAPANHLVIGEIQISGGKADDEFIELYNPADQTISLADYSVQYLRGRATSTEKIDNNKKNFKNGAEIAPKSFYLLVNKDATSTLAEKADMTYSFSLSGKLSGGVVFLVDNSEPISGLNDENIVDYAAYGETALPGISTTTLPSANQSVERKAIKDGSCVSSQNESEFLGNGCDNDDNDADFEIRQNPNPQNSASLPEPRQAPAAPQDFSIEYSSSTLELIFSWRSSQDYGGATSTITYKIFDSGASTSSPAIETASSSVSLRIDEVGRDYGFSVQAVDKDGLASGLAEKEIKVSSFIKSVDFYKTKYNNLYGETEGPLIDFSYDQYPFLPLDLVYAPQGIKSEGPNYKVLVFYSNSDAPKRKYLNNALPLDEDYDKALRLEYETCAGSRGFYNSLILPDASDRCNIFIGGFANSALRYDWYLEEGDLNFVFPVETSDGQSDFAQNDFITVAFYGFRREFPQGTDPKSLEGGVWSNFELLAVDKTRYYFGAAPAHASPEFAAGELNFEFDEENSLAIDWPKAADSDNLDSLIFYEIRYSPEDDWQSAGYATGTVREVLPDDGFQISVRARDDFNNYSESLTAEWYYPVFQQ